MVNVAATALCRRENERPDRAGPMQEIRCPKSVDARLSWMRLSCVHENFRISHRPAFH
jgi:hypothetical protein